jgi:hypothetical protein
MKRSTIKRIGAITLTASLILIISNIVSAQSGGTFNLVWFSIDGGAGSGTGDQFVLRGTIGQPEGEPLTGGEFTLHGGISKIPITVVEPPSIPAENPVLGFYVTRSVTISWNAITWASGYEVQISRSSTFATLVHSDNTLPASTLSIITPTLIDNGVYYWRVRARKPDGNWPTTWSATGIFQINAP